MRKKAFTLIELLVVISIIAMLLAILLPSLRAAKNMARVTTCAANIKQIDTVRCTYEASNKDKVPVLFNTYSYGYAPAKNAFPSLAFMDYIQLKSPLGTGPTAGLDVNQPWNSLQYLDYALTCCPEFFICPFVRGNKKEGEWVDSGTVEIKGNPPLTFSRWETRGYIESYGAWLMLYEPLKDGLTNYQPHPYGDEHGKPAFSWVNWYNSRHFYGSAVNKDPLRKNYDEVNPVSLSRFTSLSQRATLSCNQGEWIPDIGPVVSGKPRILNYKSHRKGQYGGSNVVFGDSHVEWVRGSQHGWK